MRNENAEEQSMDDLVFENRNKEYGAYAIRKAYSDNVHKALLYVFATVAAVMVFTLFFPGDPLIAPPKDSGGVIVFDFAPPLQEVKKPAKTAPVRRATRDVTPTVVDHEVKAPPVEEPTKNEGAGDPNGVVGGADPIVGAGPATEGPSVTARVEVPPSGPLDIAEVMPKYQGGLEAMARYMQKNLKYPAIARRMETEGAVFVSFVIDTEGRVIDAKVIKGISKECDAEAVRVVSKMTEWLAGRQGGVPVMVRMVLPIRFTLSR